VRMPEVRARIRVNEPHGEAWSARFRGRRALPGLVRKGLSPILVRKRVTPVSMNAGPTLARSPSPDTRGPRRCRG